MTSTRSRIRLFALAVASLLVAVLFTPAAASATTAGSCSGSVTARSTAKSGSTVVGELIVYYQSSAGGTNTACMYHRGPTYGVSLYTKVILGRCYGTDCEYAFDSPNYMQDPGTYSSYAGPVRVQHSNGNCVEAVGEIDWRGRPYYAASGKVGCS